MRNESNYLHNLGFTTDNGLVHNLDEALNNVERLYIVEAKKLEADAVFFRRKYAEVSGGQENEPIPYESIPTVCIFQKEVNFFNSKEHKELHAALWSAGKTEVYVIQSDNRIDIINARKPAKRVSNTDVTIEDKDLVLGRVKEALEAFNDRRFSAHLFGSGTFWEQSEFQEKIDGNSSPYVFLLDYLMEARRQLTSNTIIGLEATTIDKLLITSILIKFLEEIKDDNEDNTLNTIYKEYNLTSFEESLSKKGQSLLILKKLAEKFNGEIFNTFSEIEKSAIHNANLKPIANFLSADINLRTNQLFIWSQYSFKHLPAEVISAIYENFIHAEAERNEEEKKGVVYTPLSLVNLLIDEVMPLSQPELFKNNEFRVLDPSCGSGVFLVAAYKRMLQWWAINNYNQTNTIAYPDKTVAKEILERNIFGVDIEPTAALVSIFGLTTAFLDKLTPKEIWNNLKFKDLAKENIQGINFIDWARLAKKGNERFDLVIGNPPFNKSDLGTITDKDLKELFDVKVPGNKLVLKFFEAALYFGKKVCMIIQANSFLYGVTSQNYRKKIFTNYSVEKIYDFTHLRETLFVKNSLKGSGSQKKTGRTPVVAVILENVPSRYKSIEHIVVKRELFSEKKMRFEIDYYDRHQVRWDWATDEKMQMIWKTNLLGGGQLFHLIYRLNLLKKLGDFLEEKQLKNDWSYSSGYKIKHKNRKKEPADYITEKATIKPTSFDEFGNYSIIKEKATLFAEKRKKKLFEGPHIIFRLVLEKSKIPMAYVEEYLCFSITYVGISAPKKEKKDLYEIYERLFENDKTANVYRAFILGNSSRVAISHDTSILKEDIDNLPYPKNINFLIPSITETILIEDALNYYRHLSKGIVKKYDGAILHHPATPKDLKAFGKTYCNALNDIYAEDGKSWQAGEILQTPMFVCYQFGFGENGGLTSSQKLGTDEAILNLLEKTEGNSGVIHKKIIRTYQHENGYDCVYFIKPQTKRYWLKSIALRDADDTFMDLKNAGY